ncbi:hypothetical protein GCM10027059_37870 [Myceligenerans halotolerans]
MTAATWTRRVFSTTGLTQAPPGPHLEALQRRFGGGTVMLMIDVSGSMDGPPILEAVRGAQVFVQEALAARYQVGVMLWNTAVVSVCAPTADGQDARALLAPVRSAWGGNALDGPLVHCQEILDGFTGDRVVALFGDGDISPESAVLTQVARMKADNIRFVTRGLGAYAAAAFAKISDEKPQDVLIDSAAGLADGIASMATGLRTRR